MNTSKKFRNSPINKTLTAEGRESCNLNKSYVDSCIDNNRQKRSIQSICMRATVQLFCQTKFNISILYIKQQMHSINTNHSTHKIQFPININSYVLLHCRALYKNSAVAGLEVQFRWH
jgi:hypothetical protein